MQQIDMNGMLMAFFPSENMTTNVGGGLVQHEMHKPSEDGAIIYLNGNPDLALPLGKVESAGGKVIMPKTLINEDIGYFIFRFILYLFYNQIFSVLLSDFGTFGVR